MTSAASVATSEKQHDFSTHKTACAFSCSSEDQLIAQLEYYFSQDNIITDHYLRSQMDDENYVPIMTISTFTKVKQYIEDVKDPEQFIATLVQNKSDVLQVDDYGLKIRAQSGPVKYRLVVRDVPASYARDDVQQMFTNCEIKMLSAEPAGCNGMWYLGFESEQDSHSAMEHLKSNFNLKVHMKKVLAGHHVAASTRAPSANSVSGHFWNGNYPISQTPPAAAAQLPANIHYNEYGTANWTQLNRTVKGPKGAAQARTMYQPFRRGGYEQGVPANNLYIQHRAHPATFNGITYQPTNRAAHRSRPRDSKERLKVHSGQRKGADSSSPESPLVVPIPRLHHHHHHHHHVKSANTIPPATATNATVTSSNSVESSKEKGDLKAQPSFELKQFDFPTLALPSKDANSTPTPPPVNTKAEFDQLKPGQGPVPKDTNIAEMLRNQSPQQQSPSPTCMMPSSMPNVKPIGPPNLTTSNIITTTIATPTSPNEPAKTTWGASNTGKTLAQALKAKPMEKLLERGVVPQAKQAPVSQEVKKTTKKGSKSQAIKVTMVEKAEKAVEKIEQSVNKENVENGDEDGWVTQKTKSKKPRPAPVHSDDNNNRPIRADNRPRRISDRNQADQSQDNIQNGSINQVHGRRAYNNSNKPGGHGHVRGPSCSDSSSVKSNEFPDQSPPEIGTEAFGPSLGNAPFPRQINPPVQSNVSSWADIASK